MIVFVIICLVSFLHIVQAKGTVYLTHGHLHVLPHWDGICRSNLLPLLDTVYWHRLTPMSSRLAALPYQCSSVTGMTSPSSAFLSYASGVRHFGWDCCVCDRFVVGFVLFFNPAIEAVTLRLCGRCMLGVCVLFFLLFLLFVCFFVWFFFFLGGGGLLLLFFFVFWLFFFWGGGFTGIHPYRTWMSGSLLCMCAQTRPRFILSSERVFCCCCCCWFFVFVFVFFWGGRWSQNKC